MKLKNEWEIARIRKGVSWLDVAKELNVNRRTLYSMINSGNPTLKTLKALGGALGVNYADIVSAAESAK